MARRRTHSDVLISALILLGMLALGVFASHGLPTWTRPIAWFITAFLAAQVARRVLLDLRIDEVAIAAAVLITIIMGIAYKLKNHAVHVDILWRIGVAEAGALAGAFTARAREPIARPLLVVAAATAGFGGGILLTGPTMLLTDAVALYAIALLVGSFAGALLLALYTPTRGSDAALGLAVAFAILFALSAKTQAWYVNALIGVLLGAVLGSGGGAVGAMLRARRKADIPEARVD